MNKMSANIAVATILAAIHKPDSREIAVSLRSSFSDRLRSGESIESILDSLPDELITMAGHTKLNIQAYCEIVHERARRDQLERRAKEKQAKKAKKLNRKKGK